MRAFVFFSVHEPMFDGIVRGLASRGIIASVGGFVWGEQQADVLRAGGHGYDPLVVFSRDVLPRVTGSPDLDYLREREQRYGFSLNRVLLSERHQLAGRAFEERLRLLEILMKTLEAVLLSPVSRPDVVLTEDVSCMVSYLHWLIAVRNGIRFISLGQGKLTETVALYDNPAQRWNETEATLAEIARQGLSTAQRIEAERYLERFRSGPVRPPSAAVFGRLPTVDRVEAARLLDLSRRWLRDAGNPTLRSPAAAIASRVRRWVRVASFRRFENSPTGGERYALFPLQVQPEASTLVRGFLYDDQVALVRDIAKSLPIGMRLYVKEHYASRGRRSAAYYRAIRETNGVRLIAPDVDVAPLIRAAAMVLTISSTMGWEAILWERPVVTFGEVFYNAYPGVFRADRVPKDDWWSLFRDAEASSSQRESLLQFVAAVQASLHPGFKANPYTFPRVLRTENVESLVEVVMRELGRQPEPIASATWWAA